MYYMYTVYSLDYSKHCMVLKQQSYMGYCDISMLSPNYTWTGVYSTLFGGQEKSTIVANVH